MVTRRGLTTLIVVAVCAVVALLYWQDRRMKRAEEEAGLMSSRVLSAVFTANSEIKVASLTGEVFAVSRGCSLNCWVANGQETRAPYTVDYFVNLTRLPASAFRWNAKDRIMSVDIPEVTVSPPNIDMRRARTKQSGAWISRESGIAMQRQAAVYLATGAEASAKAPEKLVKARDAARTAISRFVEAPLTAAGLPGVKVVVRLPGDAKPTELSKEQWDVSRSVAEVLADMR